MKNAFGFLPKKQSFEKARDFILAHPSFTHKEYLRLFIKKYGEKINSKNFAELLVWMFELIENEE
jgi:hypothetical protein